jgi:hypothetical protein
VYYGLLASGNDLGDARHVAILNDRYVGDHCIGCELTVSAPVPAVMTVRLRVGPYGPMKSTPPSVARHPVPLHDL